MNDHLSRRRFIQWSAASTFVFHSPLHAQTNHSPTSDGKLGLLLGGLIGDALGGPVEFSEASAQEQHLVGARQWDADRQITDEDLTVHARAGRSRVSRIPICRQVAVGRTGFTGSASNRKALGGHQQLLGANDAAAAGSRLCRRTT